MLTDVRTIGATPINPSTMGWTCAMAQQTTVRFVDDLDGSEAVGTVTFALESRAYEIVAIQQGAAAVGSQAPVVNSRVRAS